MVLDAYRDGNAHRDDTTRLVEWSEVEKLELEQWVIALLPSSPESGGPNTEFPGTSKTQSSSIGAINLSDTHSLARRRDTHDGIIGQRGIYIVLTATSAIRPCQGSPSNQFINWSSGS